MTVPGDARRIWVTDQDESIEAAIIEAIKPLCKFARAIKLPKLYALDYGTMNDRDITVLLEVKNRPGLHHGYGDGYYIAASKMLAAKQMLDTFEVQSFLIVRFRDGAIYWAPLDEGSRRLIWAGRPDRPDDPMAMEPHGVIEWDKFKLMTTLILETKSSNAGVLA